MSIDFTFIFLVFMRVSGFFILSPVFSSRVLPAKVKIILSLFVSIVIAVPLYSHFELVTELPVFLLALKELALGYLIGLVFALIFEALLIGGQAVAVFMGLNVANIIDPMSGQTTSLLSQFFVLIGIVFALAGDLHHVFFRELAYGFTILPIGSYSLSESMVQHVALGGSMMFSFSLQYIAIPYVVLFLVTIGFCFLSKAIPQMNVFMIGLPIKILIGYYTLILAVGYFPVVLQRSFLEFDKLARMILKHTGV
jgi:flagellar biosynthesis protein FliR